MDQHILSCGMPYLMGTRDLLYILACMPHMDPRSIRKYIYMIPHDFFLYILHWIHKDLTDIHFCLEYIQCWDCPHIFGDKNISSCAWYFYIGHLYHKHLVGGKDSRMNLQYNSWFAHIQNLIYIQCACIQLLDFLASLEGKDRLNDGLQLCILLS